MWLHKIFHISEPIIIMKTKCGPIHSVLEISDGLDIRCLKTTRYMKYLVDSFRVWVSVPSSRYNIRRFGDAYCFHLQGWQSCSCGCWSSWKGEHMWFQWVSISPIPGLWQVKFPPKTRKSLPFKHFSIHVNQTESSLKMEPVGPSATSEHYYTMQ
jgi:hypothetical protein